MLRQLLRLRRRSEQQQYGLHLHLPLQPERHGRWDDHGQQQQQYFQLLRVQSLQFVRLLRVQSLQFVRLLRVQSLQFVRLQSLQFVRLLRFFVERLSAELIQMAPSTKRGRSARSAERGRISLRAAHFSRLRHTMEGRREPI